MPITISTYTTFDELCGLLEKLPPDAVFVVPTAHDGEWILKMQGGEDALFARFKACVWSDLYRDFAAQFHAKPIRQVDPPDNNLILRHIIKAYLDENPDVVKNLPGVARSGFADILGNALHELMREEVSVESLLSLDHDTPEHALLVGLYQKYIEYLDENSLMDSAQVATRTREILAGTSPPDPLSINDEGEKNFVFVGFTSFTLGQRRLVLEMSRVGADILILKPEANVAGLQDASAQFESFPHGSTSQHEGGDYFIFESADVLCELDLLARELALWAQGHGCFSGQQFPGWGEIGILTSHSRAAALEQALARFRIPTSSFVGSRVCNTAIGYLPRRIYENELETLVSHPCLSSSSGANVLPSLEKFRRAIKRGGTPVDLLSTLFTLVSAKGFWLDSLFEAIKHEKRGNLDGELRELSSAIDELERKIIFMKELQPAIGAAGAVTFSHDGAIEFLTNWAQNAQTATSPAIDGAVSVFADLPPLANFEVFAITGVTAKEYPGALVSSPLLDDKGREKLNGGNEKSLPHLPTLHEQRVQKEALLKRLLYAGRNFTIVSRPLADESGRPLSASPCLAPVLKSEKWRKIGDGTRTISIPKDEPYWGEIEICADEKQNPRSKPIGERKGISEVRISSLDELVACPFLFWAKYIEKLAEPQRELYDHMRAGMLAHKLWELSWTEKKQTREPLEKIAREVWKNERDVRSKYPELFSDNRLSRRCDALRDQIFACAKLQDDIEEKLDTHRVDIEVEKDVSFESDGIVFKGRCDRVDILKDGGIVIIDYKAGKSEQKLQLGAYLIAYLAAHPEYHASGAGHISLRGETLSGTFDSPLDEIYLGKKGKKKVSDLISKTEEAMKAAVETIQRGKFSPNYDAKTFCRYCAYVPICRRAEFKGDLTAEDDE